VNQKISIRIDLIGKPTLGVLPERAYVK